MIAVVRHVLTGVMLAVLAPVAAAGQSAPAPADTITVTGVRSTPEQVHSRAVEFVHATGVAAGDVPAARWAEAVCPHAVGLNDAPAQLVEAQLRAIAADAHVPVAPVPCTTNIAVVFTTDAGATVRDIAARAPRQLSGVGATAVHALTDGAAPIRWWYTSEVRDKDGIAASATSPPAGIVGGTEGGGSVLQGGNADTTFVQHYNTSLVSTEDVRVLRGATVVVDVARTDGLPLSAVTAYAAIVAFAEIRPGAAPPDSVLGLFAGGKVERRPTAWDLAFLRALYRLPLDRTALRQRSLLVSDLVAAQR